MIRFCDVKFTIYMSQFTIYMSQNSYFFHTNKGTLNVAHA